MNFYTDGAVSNNGYSNAIGGIGVVVVDDEDKIIDTISKGYGQATNQKMELQAVLSAFEYAKTHNIEHVNIFSDSAYFCNCFFNRWYLNWEKNGYKNAKKEPIANKDIWIEIIKYFKMYSGKLTITKVKGHADNKYNNMADRLAVSAKEKMQL